MMSSLVVPFSDLARTDLLVDAAYQGGDAGNLGDDPLHPLLKVGVLGGFRYKGSVADKQLRLCVLYSETNDPDWPDALYPETGQFLYFGDNKNPGHELHDTPRQGNLILRNVFDELHAGNRRDIPPFFVFTRGTRGRDVIFRGLAVPGAVGVSQTEDLVAIWKTKKGQRFQNYRATFSILDVPVVKRAWLEEILLGTRLSTSAPDAWTAWVRRGIYRPLQAPQTLGHRTPSEQLPSASGEKRLLEQIVDYFNIHPSGAYAFEYAAADLVRRMDTNVVSVDVTQPWKDGGRDGIGVYRIGTKDSQLMVEFAVEAKCKKPSTGNSSGVRETSRLISRLRHRQFGVFVTTSCVNLQAYKEIIEDRHPVLVLAGKDIVSVLLKSNINSAEKVDQWLREVAP
jgi:hypothetical protein